VLGAEGAALLWQKQNRYFARRQAYTFESRNDLSFVNPKFPDPPKLARLRITHLAPGREEDFTNWIKSDLLPAARKADVRGLWFARIRFGGNTTDFFGISPVESFAELGKLNVIMALGTEESRKSLEKLRGVTAGNEDYILRLRADLSLLNGQVAAAK
jgi:hypothetical protein